MMSASFCGWIGEWVSLEKAQVIRYEYKTFPHLFWNLGLDYLNFQRIKVTEYVWWLRNTAWGPEPQNRRVDAFIFVRGCGTFQHNMTTHLRSHWGRVTGVPASRFCPPLPSIWASDDPITLSLERRGGVGVFWGPYLPGENRRRREGRDGQKLLILSKGLFHSAEFAPMR